MNQIEMSVREKLNAIETIVKTLSPFKEAEANDIIAFARKHLNHEEVVGPVAKQVQATTAIATTETLIADNIAKFVGEKMPKNEYQRVAVLAYFLFKVRDQTSFTQKDLTEANREARQPAFSNLSATVNKALTRYKYLSAASQRGVYSISYDGEKVVEALPSSKDLGQATRAPGKARKHATLH